MDRERITSSDRSDTPEIALCRLNIRVVSNLPTGRRQCSCCPYGYHIDLDFVRYCESITNAQLMPSASVRRSRWNNVRRKRASREALLGLDIKPEVGAYLGCLCSNEKYLYIRISVGTEDLLGNVSKIITKTVS